MRTTKSILSFLAVTILSLLMGSPIVASGPVSSVSQLSPSLGKEWSIFTHPEFGFSFSYPSNWYLENNLSLENPSGTVSIASVGPKALTDKHSEFNAMTIEIGLHLVEWNENVTPREWLNAYDDTILDMLGIKNPNVSGVWNLKVDGNPAVRKVATSPILTYDVVNIQHGNMMWFIWRNDISEYQDVFERVVQSFQWGDNSLRNFSDVGIHPVMKLNIAEKTLSMPNTERIKKETIAPALLRGIPSDPPGYRMPFNGGYYITAGPGSTCGSPNHTGNAAEAIDFGTPNLDKPEPKRDWV